MHQSFKDLGDRASGPAHVKALRAHLKAQKLDGFMVPRADEHLGEYVPPSAERLAWLTGFTGSAGSCIVLANEAILFVDGRYGLQAKAQTEPKTFKIVDVTQNNPAQWLEQALKPGQRLGIDPRLHSSASVKQLKASCTQAGAKLIAVKTNLIDDIWHDQPHPPKAPVQVHPVRLAGLPSKDKLEGIAVALKVENQDAVILTAPDSIAWVFNIRGQDLKHTPVVLCFAILKARGKHALFIDPGKLDNKTKSYLSELTQIFAPDKLVQRLEKLGKAKARVRLDDNTAAFWFEQQLTSAGAEIIHAQDPCLLPKACKTRAEINGARAAHIRDGVALCRFLAWLAGTKTKLDEITAAQKLEGFRAQSPDFKDLSFPSISAVGPNGAIVHYRVSETSNRKFENGTLYLIDSGAQYPDGTTDVTRTIAIGKPSAEMRRNFTLVLKGHIALSMARFAKGTTGAHLDALARMPLWQAGLDFDHGTGHGIGSYLSVHEGPQGISKRSFAVPLEPGMILSNEPGYYKQGEYGIRIENLVLVEEIKPPKGGERTMLGFETLTLAPIDRRLIEVELLSKQELVWLNDYHQRVFTEIGPELLGTDKTWLKQVCAALK
jgi:Xaa-Pro aminopeptidase